MEAPQGTSETPKPSRERLRQAAAEAASVTLLAAGALALAVFAGRREIGRELAMDYLRERGVEAAFDIDTLDAGAFGGSVRLGPANNPVFTAERVEVAYELSPPWAGPAFKLKTRAIRLVRPRVRLAWDGEKISAGALDPIIADFLKRPRTEEPGPAVLIENGYATIATARGPVRLAADVALDDSELVRLDGRLLATRLSGDDFLFETEGGAVSLRRAGKVLRAEIGLTIDTLQTPTLDLIDADTTLSGTLPYPDLQKLAFNGPAALRAAVRAGKAGVGEASATGLEANATFTGQLDGSPRQAFLSGRLAATGRAEAFAGGGTQGRDGRADLDLTGLSLARDATGLRFTAAAQAQARAGRAGVGRALLQDASALIRTPRLIARFTDDETALDGPFTGQFAANRIADGDIALTVAAGTGSGRFHADREGLTLAMDGQFSGLGSVAPHARAIPVLSDDPEQGRAIAAALASFEVRAPRWRASAAGGQLRLSLAAPVTLVSASGGRATLSPRGGSIFTTAGSGAFDLAVSGGGLPQLSARVSRYSLSDGLDAQVALEGALDLPPAQDAVLKLDGRLRSRDGHTTFALARCGDFAAGAVDMGEMEIGAVKARLCPSEGPLLGVGGGSWHLAASFEDGEAAIGAANAQAGEVFGAFEIGSGPGSVRLDRAFVSDAEGGRFNPLRASGRMDRRAGVWRGTFNAASNDGDPVAAIAVTHDERTDRGRADIDASRLAFSPALQPAELTPLAAFLTEAEGSAAFTGHFAWTAEGSTSGGRLTVAGLDARTPLGRATRISSDTAFTSLTPLTTAPGQTLTAQRIDWLVPLETFTASFQLGAKAVAVEAASFQAAGGRVSAEPFSAPFGEGAVVRGALVLDKVQVGRIVEATSLAEQVKVDASVSGRLPFEFDAKGVRLTEGRLHAAGPGRISIQRSILSKVETGAAPQGVNAMQDFAYQAMENLAFDTLEAGVDSTPDGRLKMLFHIDGRHDPKLAEQARIRLADLLNGKAFQQRIALPKGTPVDLTLDTSLNFDELVQAWRRGWRSAEVQP